MYVCCCLACTPWQLDTALQIRSALWEQQSSDLIKRKLSDKSWTMQATSIPYAWQWTTRWHFSWTMYLQKSRAGGSVGWTSEASPYRSNEELNFKHLNMWWCQGSLQAVASNGYAARWFLTRALVQHWKTKMECWTDHHSQLRRWFLWVQYIEISSSLDVWEDEGL